MTAASDPRSRPSRLGRYELITQIGQGGMAEVQLALQRGPAGFEKLVVVKLVHENLATQKDFVDMLLDEARVAAMLKHPNVVDIYDLGEADGRFFIAMEYLEGEPLLAVLRAGREGQRLDPLSSARLISDTAEGLDAAHELRSLGGELIELVHHDISLGNIVVLYNGQVKLVDFGVAKATQTTATRNRVQGKFSYMAPEKLLGGAGDRRSDIWSLGCVMWEALTLKRLFKGGNEHDTMQQVLSAKIPTPSMTNPTVPAELDHIVLKALSREPEDRYPTARAMAKDIEEVLRVKGYGGRNDIIATWMQSTFETHIAARKKLLQEVSSKGRASAAVLEAAFAEPIPVAMGSGDNSGMFSVKFRRGDVAEGTPQGLPKAVRVSFKMASTPPPVGEPMPPGALPLIDVEQRSKAPSKPPVDHVVPPGHVTRVDSRRTLALVIGVAIVLLGVVIGLVVRSLRHREDAPPFSESQLGPVAVAVDAAPDVAPVAVVPVDAAEPAVVADASEPIDAAADPEIQIDPKATDETVMPVDPVAPGGSATPRSRPRTSAAEHTKNGLNSFVRGDPKAALALYRKAIAVDSGYAPAWRASGFAHERLGEKSAAKAAFQRYLRLAPKADDAAQIKQRLEKL